MTQLLQPLDIIRPGSKGLNTQETGNEDLGFCVEATNCIIDKSGRLSARKGWSPYNSAAFTSGFSASGSNQLTSPRDFTNAAWVDIGTPTVTYNQVGIEGFNTTASYIEDDSAAQTQGKWQTITIPDDSNNNTISYYIRKTNGTPAFWPLFGVSYDGGTQVSVQLSINTATGAYNVRSGIGVYSVTVDEETAWWRVSITAQNNSTGNTSASVYVYPSAWDAFDGSSSVAETGSIVVDYAEFLLNTSTASTQTLTTLTVTSISEHISNGGTETRIFTPNGLIYKDPSNPSDITGTITSPTAYNWQWANFNGYIIGVQDGHNPVAWNGSGNFADVANASTAGSMPNGNCILSAFGRVWITTSDTDKTKIRYSDTLDHTTWDDDSVPGAAGVLDLKSVVGWGQDTVTALAEHNGHLVIFGKHNIAIYRNPWNPNNNDAGTQAYGTFELADIIRGVGCIARDSVVSIGSDLLFLSDTGVQSLGRVLVEKSLPINDISANVRDDLLTLVSAETDSTIKAAFDDVDGRYLLVLKNSTAVYAFDTRRSLPDGTFAVTKWEGINPQSIFHSRDDKVYMGHSGYVSNHTGYQDNGATYEWTYKSSWQSLGTDALKLPKKWQILAEGGGGYSIQVRTYFDYSIGFRAEDLTVPSATGVAEWGESEWGEAEWSGSGTFQELKAFGVGSGRTISVGLNTTINGNDFAVQRILIMLKAGRKP